MVKDDPESGLEFLSELPCAWDGRGGVVENVADEVETGDFAGDGGAVDEEGCNYYVAYLKVK